MLDSPNPEDIIIVNEIGWPTWLRDGFNYLEGEQLGRIFMQAVEYWTVLERSYNWEKNVSSLCPS